MVIVLRYIGGVIFLIMGIIILGVSISLFFTPKEEMRRNGWREYSGIEIIYYGILPSLVSFAAGLFCIFFWV